MAPLTEKQAGRLIFLVGFMGSGKTTVGRLLAHRLGYSFVDLDQLIEHRAGKKVSEIFSDLREEYFRKLERETLAKCRALVEAVIALGGGAYAASENRQACRTAGKTVWLRCPVDVCLARVVRDGSRPLLGDRAAMETLLLERARFYAEAEFVVDSDAASPGEIVDAIVALMSHGKSG